MRGFVEAGEGEWIAVQVRAGLERDVSRSLRLRGYEDFLPITKSFAPWKARASSTESALFPGYIFCRYELEPHSRIVEIPGVVRLVGCRSRVAAISEQEIETIRRVSEANVRRKSTVALQEGDQVEIVNGPLLGIRGTFVRQKRGNWLVVSVPLITSAMAVEISGAMIRPVKPEMSRAQ